MSKNLLKLLIKEELRRFLNEQQGTPPPADEPVEEPITDTSGDTTPTDTGAEGSDLDLSGDGTDIEDGDATTDIEGGDLGGSEGEIGPDGEPLEGDEDFEDIGSDFGGFSGGGGGGGGFSGGGGGDDMDGDEGESGGEEMSPPHEPKIDPDDPVGAVMDEALEAIKKTVDPQQITNQLKATIALNFKSFDDAWPVVKELRKTKNKTLASVADRLTLFIAGI